MLALIRTLLIPVFLVLLLLPSAMLGAVYPDKVFSLIPPCTISQFFGETTKSRESTMTWIERLRWRVVDGDTLHCERRNVRLYGFDTPEPRARCLTKEKLWGQAASRRMRELLRTRSWRTEYTGQRDGRARMIVRLRNQGRSIPAILIEEGLALPLREGQERPDWSVRLVRNPAVIRLMTDHIPLGSKCAR